MWWLWPPYGIGQAIIFFALWVFLSSSFFFFFPRLISAAVGDWMSTILPRMAWPYCEFRMHVWNLLHAARWKYRTQNWRRKKSPSGHHRARLYLRSVTARHSTIGRQPNFAASNRGRHVYSAGRPSRWALAHISSLSSSSRRTDL